MSFFSGGWLDNPADGVCLWGCAAKWAPTSHTHTRAQIPRARYAPANFAPAAHTPAHRPQRTSTDYPQTKLYTYSNFIYTEKKKNIWGDASEKWKQREKKMRASNLIFIVYSNWIIRREIDFFFRFNREKKIVWKNICCVCVCGQAKKICK